MIAPDDWLTDEMADQLLAAEGRPHPTIPAAELATLKKALDDALSTTHCHLRAAHRLALEGGAFEQHHRAWRQRHAVLVYVLCRYNDARIRREDVDMADLWARLESVRAHFIGHAAAAGAAREEVG